MTIKRDEKSRTLINAFRDCHVHSRTVYIWHMHQSKVAKCRLLNQPSYFHHHHHQWCNGRKILEGSLKTQTQTKSYLEGFYISVSTYRLPKTFMLSWLLS